MPVWLVSLATMLSMLLIPLLKRAMLYLGIGTVTYMGVNAAISELQDIILGSAGSIALPYQQVAGLLKIDICINIMLAAIAARLLLSGVSRANGAITKFKLGGGSEG